MTSGLKIFCEKSATSMISMLSTAETLKSLNELESSLSLPNKVTLLRHSSKKDLFLLKSSEKNHNTFFLCLVSFCLEYLDQVT